ncbi:hypothetical protein IFM89_008644 [Coptis chinensis]|uniref:Protein kinase domain-containing protein n=1 Tax=Coptis chinensis TaxID=261450 RepID=A0A835LHE6_9MAGN|nr:hypothetical protein IFM89_008644 [Coptis chinensis]
MPSRPSQTALSVFTNTEDQVLKSAAREDIELHWIVNMDLQEAEKKRITMEMRERQYSRRIKVAFKPMLEDIMRQLNLNPPIYENYLKNGMYNPSVQAWPGLNIFTHNSILIDEEHNARVADFGLSLLGPADSTSPLAELPAGSLGYLDPEYYRLHYLTTKSDVYSFGVLLLEILSGRKAIDMQFEEGNIVEWAVPQIKAGDIAAILDSALKTPKHLEALTRIANVAC